jgi:large subunit ribosomal protein L10
MPTTRKKETVKELQELFSGSQVLIFTDYRGLSVSDITNLRRQLRDKGVEYHVTKNTLTTLAAERAGLTELATLLDGPTAIAFVGEDIPGAAKVLTDFARTSRILQIRGGLMGRSVISSDQVGDLTKILSREEYIAKILGSMQSPASNIVNALAGVLRGFMNVMQARVDQLKEQGDTGEAPEAAPAATAETSTAATAEVETPAAPAAAAPTAAAPAETVETPSAEAEAAPAETPVAAAPTETASPTAAVETRSAEAEAAPAVESPVAEALTETAAPVAAVETPAAEATEVAEAPTAEAPAEAAEPVAALPAEPAAEAEAETAGGADAAEEETPAAEAAASEETPAAEDTAEDNA